MSIASVKLIFPKSDFSYFLKNSLFHQNLCLKKDLDVYFWLFKNFMLIIFSHIYYK